MGVSGSAPTWPQLRYICVGFREAAIVVPVVTDAAAHELLAVAHGPGVGAQAVMGDSCSVGVFGIAPKSVSHLSSTT